VALGYALDWIDWTYGGTVIGGGCVIALIVGLGVAVLVALKAKPKQGMLSVEGTRMSGPDEDSAIDFNAAHDIEVSANDHEAHLVIRVAGAGTATMAPDEIGRQLAKQVAAGWALGLKGVSAAELRDRFELAAYVGPLESAEGAGITLDRQDPQQQPLIDPLLGAIARCRSQNVRYQAFAALPWQQAAAPATPPLRDIALQPGTDPKTFFSQLAASPAGADPANPHAVIAKAYLDVRLWLGDQVGVTPDYLLIDAFGGLEERADHSYTLVPIGAGRCTVRRDMHRVTTTSTASVGSTTYPALVVEAPALGEPVWVVFPKALWDNADNQLDATVAFVSRA
ncbi:MAG: hypothetical protein JRI68_11980, partial [Deltaproteobacteria bacterium]|nr:hypothetical protein [Deltaproteobacteria bacterium]